MKNTERSSQLKKLIVKSQNSNSMIRYDYNKLVGIH